MGNRMLDLRKVFGMIVSFDDKQSLVSPDKPFEVMTELYPGGESAIHVHPHQVEIYEVKEGEMQVYLDGSWKTLKAGDSVTIAKGKVHGFRNTGEQKAVAFNSHNPGLRFGEMLVTIQRYIDQGKITSTKGFKNLAHMALIMVEYKEVMRTVKPPAGLIKLMAKIGRMLGYS